MYVDGHTRLGRIGTAGLCAPSLFVRQTLRYLNPKPYHLNPKACS